MHKRDWKKIGVVGVDSGQILLTDPCYIGDDWDSSLDAARVFGDSYILTQGDGTEVEVKNSPFMSIGATEGHLPFNWEEPFMFEGETVTKNQLRENGQLREVTPPVVREYNYSGCCSVSSSDERGGQLNFARGHAGAGVCVSSGYGDGLYNVFALYDKKTGRVAAVMVDFLGIMGDVPE